NNGIKEITQVEEDMGRFKVPSLRNIALTAPYMHDGSVATLREAIAHYQAGGRTIPAGEWAGVGSNNPYKSGFIKGFTISESEIEDLLAFLESLTDEDFITNPDYSDPNQASSYLRLTGS
ncbi:MAG: di-heme enzyme, partial [Cyanobacteria bacterium J06621_12]